MSAGGSRDEWLFADALARPKGERALFLAQACEGNAVLLARVAALVAAHEGPEAEAPSALFGAHVFLDWFDVLQFNRIIGPQDEID